MTFRSFGLALVKTLFLLFVIFHIIHLNGYPIGGNPHCISILYKADDTPWVRLHEVEWQISASRSIL